MASAGSFSLFSFLLAFVRMHFVTRFCSLVSSKIDALPCCCWKGSGAAINTNSLSISERLCRLLPLSSSSDSIFSSLFYDSFAFTFNCLSIKVQGAKNWHFIVHHDSNDQIYTYILYYQDWSSNISLFCFNTIEENLF